MDLIDNYDDKTVSEVEDALEAQDFSADELREIRAYESEHKNRSTLISEIDEELDDNESSEDDSEETESDASQEEEEPDSDSESESDDEDLVEPVSRLMGADEEADPVWVSPKTSRVGEYLFRTLYTPKKIRRTRNVQKALEMGRAVEVKAPEE